MNHYLKNIAAKNLHLMDVIMPRLASRFEPASRHSLPAEWGLQSFVGKDIEPMNAEDRYSHDHNDRDPSDHFSPDHYARVAVRNIVRSSPALAVRSPDSSGHESIFETESARAAGLQSQQYRSMPPISETKTSFRAEEIAFDRSSVSRLASPAETSPAPGTVQKTTKEIELKHRPPLEGSAPTREEQIFREPGHKMKSARRRTSERPRPDGNVSLLSQEEKPVSPEQESNLSLKSVDRLASGIEPREEEIIPAALIEVNEKKSGAKHDIRHKIIEPIASIKPLMPSISPVMVAAVSNSKSYFGPKRNEISEKVAKPETSASVQVTIGRIEIRAMPATATPQRKRTEPPVMSLEDYLKNKRGSL